MKGGKAPMNIDRLNWCGSVSGVVVEWRLTAVLIYSNLLTRPEGETKWTRF
jgi:hypothetical protein